VGEKAALCAAVGVDVPSKKVLQQMVGLAAPCETDAYFRECRSDPAVVLAATVVACSTVAETALTESVMGAPVGDVVVAVVVAAAVAAAVGLKKGEEAALGKFDVQCHCG
jgi:hypothetical protein